ncbi:hypothetical protein ACFFRR_008102 [Megaselia abdita]
MCYYDYDCTADIIWSIVSIILFFIIISVLLRLCFVRRRRTRGVVVGTTAPVVVTTTTQAVPVQTSYYPTQVTPAVVAQQGVNYQMPHPQPYIANQNVAQPPYPVANQSMPQPQGFNQLPPSYDQVQSHENMYTKQPPYNPNFSGQ